MIISYKILNIILHLLILYNEIISKYYHNIPVILYTIIKKEIEIRTQKSITSREANNSWRQKRFKYK